MKRRKCNSLILTSNLSFFLATAAARDSAIQTQKTLLEKRSWRNTRVDWSQLEAARDFDLENLLGIICLAGSDQTLLHILAVAIDRVLRLVRIVEVDEWVEETGFG